MTKITLSKKKLFDDLIVDDIPVKQHVLKKAQYGDGLAICRIGRIYYDRKEYTKAIDWFRLGVVKGLANAQFLVGLMRHQGEGVTKDYGLALKWFLEGAKKADGFCQYSIGLYYEYGYGVDIDKQFALKYFEKSAQQGYKYTKEEIKYLNEQGYFIDDEQKKKYLKELKQKRLRFNDENELPKQKKKKALKLEHETDSKNKINTNEAKPIH